MKAYKLMRKMANGALRSLFIDKSGARPLGVWLPAEYHPTKGYENRFGWHCTFQPYAPHLTLINRVWVEVELDGEIEIKNRPECQGGRWILAAGRIKIIRELSKTEVQQIIKRNQNN